MTRVPRFIGYGFMVAAALLAVAMREGRLAEVGPFPAIAVALFLGMLGVMLVFTDLMVRGLYAQVDTAKRALPDDHGPDGRTGKDDED